MRLQGKVILITGAAGGIGAATALAMAREGAELALVDQDLPTLEHLFAGLPARPLLLTADVTQPGDCARMVDQAVARFGPLDAFFANAGVEGLAQSLTDYPLEVYERVMNVNVKGVLLGLQQAAPAMRDGGSMILTSSIAGLIGMDRNSVYTASKHAVVGLMRSAARELAPRGIRVNSIHPGFVDTPMLRRLIDQHPDPAAQERKLIERTKLGRLLRPEDIASAVVFLASDDSSMISGQTLVIDGCMIT